jgi:hypothetical protein
MAKHKLVYAVSLVAGLSGQAMAVTEDFRGVFDEAELQVLPSEQKENRYLGEEAVSIDFTAMELDYSNILEQEASRLYNFADLNATGQVVESNEFLSPDDCDGASPCPEPISLSSNYLTIGGGSEPGGAWAKGAFTPNNALIAYVFGEGSNFDSVKNPQQGNVDVGMEVLIDKPTTLSNADLNGNYYIAVRVTGYYTDSTLPAGYFEEYALSLDVEASFAGDGSCTISLSENAAWQGAIWPSFSERQNIWAYKLSNIPATCSYIVDNASGTVTLNIDGDDVVLFVSSDYRYLLGRDVVADQDVLDPFFCECTYTDYSHAMLVGTKRPADNANNNSLQGVFLSSILWSGFSNSFAGGTGGMDNDGIVRRAIEFNPGEVLGDGWSGCNVLGENYATLFRGLAGSADSPTKAFGFTPNINPAGEFCRYQVDGVGTVTIERSDDNVNWVSATTVLSDDGNSLISAWSRESQVLVEDLPTLLDFPASAIFGVSVATKFNGQASDSEVADFLRPLIRLGAVPNDYDADGDTDVLMKHDSFGYRLFTMQNGAVQSVANPGLWNDPAWPIVANEDFDGDGDTDVLMKHDSFGYRLFTIQNGAVQSVANPGLWNDPAWPIVANEDFDGDGDTDVLMKHDSFGYRLFTMQNGAVQSVANPGLWNDPAWMYLD